MDAQLDRSTDPAPPGARLLATLLLALMALGAAACATEDEAIVGTGTIEARGLVVAAESAGHVAEVLVRAGEEVTAGQPLLRLDPQPLDATREEAEAALELARARRELARRAPGLFESLDPAAADAAVEEAELALALLDLERERLTLRAPVDGRVIHAPELPGLLVLPGAPLLRLAESGDPEITIYLAETDLDEVALGDEAEVEVDAFVADRDADEDEDPLTFEAEVIRIAPQAEFTPRNVQTRDARARLVRAVTLRVADDKARLRSGMPAEVRLER